MMSAIAFAGFGIASTGRVHAAPQSMADRVAKDQAGASPVKIYPKSVVDGQFENNKLILEPGHNGQFFVETSRRLKDGEPQTTMVNGNSLPPGQIHGKTIIGGTSAKLNAGDFVVIPSGQPHMFTEVQPPFWYLVVKVRNPGKLGGAPKVP
jgi:hypothetical protein